MAVIESGSVAGQLFVDDNQAARVSIVPRDANVGGVGGSYKIATVTGTIAAAQGIGLTYYSQRLDPTATGMIALIEKIRLQYVTVVAYTVPMTAARSLGLYRGSGAATTGGGDLTAVDSSSQVDTAYPISECLSQMGGSTRVASGTAGMTNTGITYESLLLGNMQLAHVGALGNMYEKVWEWDSSHEHPLVLNPGELLAVRNVAAMDAGGTWQLGIEVEWSELVPG